MNQDDGFFLFRVFTPAGRFHLTVEADSWESAEELAKALFDEEFSLEVTELRRAKYVTGEAEETLFLSRARDDDPHDEKPWRGMRLYAAKKMWDHLGKGVEFEAEKIRMESAWPGPREETIE